MEHNGMRMEYNSVWVRYEWDMDGTWREYGWNTMEYDGMGGIWVGYGGGMNGIYETMTDMDELWMEYRLSMAGIWEEFGCS